MQRTYSYSDVERFVEKYVGLLQEGNKVKYYTIEEDIDDEEISDKVLEILCNHADKDYDNTKNSNAYFYLSKKNTDFIDGVNKDLRKLKNEISEEQNEHYAHKYWWLAIVAPLIAPFVAEFIHWVYKQILNIFQHL